MLTADDQITTDAFPTTITNKTISNTTNTLQGVAQNATVRRWGSVQPTQGATAAAIVELSGALAKHTPTSAGTASETFDTTEGVIATFTSSTTAGNSAGIVSPVGGVGICRRSFAGRLIMRGKIDSTTTGRFYFGLTSGTAIDVTGLLSTQHGVIVGFDATDTNWTIMTNDGATSVTRTNVTGPIAKDANYHTIEISWPASGNITVIFDGTSQTVSTDLPGTSTNLFFNAVVQPSSTTARALLLHSIWVEFDK